MTDHNSYLSADYGQFLQSLKERIQNAQVRAMLSINRDLVSLYWEIGREILDRQEIQGWGSKVVERLSRDLRQAFPEMKGFSPRNVKYMRLLAETYQDERFVQQAVAQIPWGHNIRILDKVKSPDEREFYITQTINNGWSRNILALQIESKLYERQGKAVTNFELTLPKHQSDLAKDILKDPYNFDFLLLGSEAQERDVENALLVHLRKFLLEMGVGFAFVGNQYHLEVGDKDFYIDLLFYHLGLRCFVVIDLKMREFQPEDGGKMNFYLSAVDDLLRHEKDQPSIGLILCREKNRFIAEYAIRNIKKPIGVADYQFIHNLPENLEGSLPTIKELENTASDKFLSRINNTPIEPDELFEALKRRQERPDLDVGIESNIPILLEQFGKGSFEKISAVLFRIWALMSLIERQQLPAEWVEKIDEGSINVFEPILVAASTEPLIVKGNDLEFEVSDFVRRVKEIAASGDYND